MSTGPWFYKISDLSVPETVRNRIRLWTGDKDYLLAIKYQVGGWTNFTDTPPPANVMLSYDPPGDMQRPGPGRSFHTTFDDLPFSARAEDYQEVAIAYYADVVLTNFLHARRYVVEPTVEVREALGGRLPASEEDIAAFLGRDPSLIRHVSYVEQGFEPRDLSQGAKAVIRALLEDRDSLARYLESPESFVYGVEGRDGITETETDALIRAAQVEPEMVHDAFDHVELGRSTLGDGDAYLLIGFDRQTGRPSGEGISWFQTQLEQFIAANGFTPGFGWYVTEASTHYHVVAGPGVTTREIEFLQAQGQEVIDKRDGSYLEEPLPRYQEPMD
jgi:hypothetical protein